MPGPDAPLALAEYLAELQVELSEARLQAEGRDLNFSLDRVTVEAELSYTLADSANSSTAKPKFWVIRSAGQGPDDRNGSAYRQTQRLSVQFNRRSEATAVDAPDHVATIPVLSTAPLTKPNR